MGLLERLGLRQSSIWDPPTLLDELLASPLQYLMVHIYGIILFLRGSIKRNSSKSPIRVVCISDTHDQTVNIPPGDLLIHAGDLTNDGTVTDIQKQLDWLDSQPHRHKVVICGNHDSWFDPKSRKQEDKASGAKPDLKSIHYLERSSVALEFPDSKRTLNVYGAPDLPRCGGSDFAFQYQRHLPPWKNTIPVDTDILVTHAPPRYHRDLHLGCFGILEEVWRVKPRLHVFGHIHWGKGREVAHFDECQQAYESLMARPKKGAIYDMTDKDRWIDALRIVLFGAYYVLSGWVAFIPARQMSTPKCLMVNAAQMHGNTGKMGNKVEVVEL